jgi:hypothetical protein
VNNKGLLANAFGVWRRSPATQETRRPTYQQEKLTMLHLVTTTPQPAQPRKNSAADIIIDWFKSGGIAFYPKGRGKSARDLAAMVKARGTDCSVSHARGVAEYCVNEQGLGVRLGEDNAHGAIYIPGKAVRCGTKGVMIVPHSDIRRPL